MDENLKRALREHLGKAKSSKGLSDMLQELFKEAVQELLQAEMEEHLGYEKHASNSSQFDNNRNGKTRKTIKSKFGKTEIEVPRDRDGTFEPQVIPKRKRIIEEIEDHVLSLYTHGLSTRDIESHIRDLYGVEMSEATISHITDRIIDHIEQWKTRRLQQVYMVVWMDAIVFKVRQDGKVVDKAVQIAVGLNNEGYKEVLGMWLCQHESAAYWMSVLTNLKSRGVEDILVSSTDNLKGFTDAIKAVFPDARTQICIVHQLRNSLKFVVWKDKTEVARALKQVYDAPDVEIAANKLDAFEEQWAKKYPYIGQSWRNNWDKLTTFFEFPMEIRKIIYTTNIIENINRIIRKYTKTKTALPNDTAVEKAVYLALMQVSRKWTMPQVNWPIMLLQFINIFGKEKCRIKI
ncbi:MAG TPA: IS256 family transposase [Sedimentisphaerales bacterium]|nr:IS256 family transposase [Sedimentisphaerales bacterium]